MMEDNCKNLVHNAVVNKHRKGRKLWDFTHGLKIVVWEGISLQPLVLRKHGFMGY